MSTGRTRSGGWRAIEVFRAAALERHALEAERANLRTAELKRKLEQEQRGRAADEADAARSRQLGTAAKALEHGAAESLARLRDSARGLASASADLGGHSATASRNLAQVRSAVTRAVHGATDIATATATDQFMTALGWSSDSTRRSASWARRRPGRRRSCRNRCCVCREMPDASARSST